MDLKPRRKKPIRAQSPTTSVKQASQVPRRHQIGSQKNVHVSLVRTRSTGLPVANWQNLKTLGFVDPLGALKKRCPEFVKRYADEEDEFGFKIDVFARWEPFFRFCFEDYFKVEVRGLENVPRDGSALFIGNHSGLLPIDAECSLFRFYIR